jgi:hypothetical protein
MNAEDESERRTKPPRKGNWRQPPRHGGFSIRNSHTSPKTIALLRKQAGALNLRAQGYSYAQIAQHTGRPVNTIFRWVSESLDRLIREPSEQILRLELARLDDLQSICYQSAHHGDLGAIHMMLRIIDQRSRLLGLYPKEPTLNLNMVADPQPLQVTFIVPGQRDTPPAPVDVSPQPAPDYTLKTLPKPPERVRGPLGWLEERPPGKSDWMR